ncbi:MAG: cupin domain-containing protein [Chloroflexi bacterium]|nr:cupin domain-containing protein [Chloroflexota bacterium]
MKRGDWLFGSFFLGGFECSQQVTAEGRRLDLIVASQHDVQAAEDYARCREIGIRAVREAVRWPMVDRGGTLDLEELRRLVRLAREAEVVQIWDLMHYGYPDDLEPFSAAFVDRFATYARAVASIVCDETGGPTYYTPINEISYYAWAGGEVGYMGPLLQGRGGKLKRALVRAAIAATNAIWEADPEAQIVTVDPLVWLHVPPERPDLQPEVDDFNRRLVTEAFDLLAGRRQPELGGSRAHLGIMAVNYYGCNQWTIPTPELPQRFLTPDDPRWVPLSDLLLDLQARYGGPLLIGETGASADARAAWIDYLCGEAAQALERGVNLQGICWYPIVTTPDWEDTTAFLEGGLFDVIPEPDGRLRRALDPSAAAALRRAQAALDPESLPTGPVPPECPPPREPRVEVIHPLEHAQAKADNFSHQTLLTGESLTVELYTFGPGAWIGAHRHPASEHVLTVVAGVARVRIGTRWLTLHPTDTVVVPPALPHSIHNDRAETLVVQQVSAPKPWDARFAGPGPAESAVASGMLREGAARGPSRPVR